MSDRVKEILFKMGASAVFSTLGVIAIHFKIIPMEKFSARYDRFNTFSDVILFWTTAFVGIFIFSLFIRYREEIKYICPKCKEVLKSEEKSICPICGASMVPLEGFYEN